MLRRVIRGCVLPFLLIGAHAHAETMSTPDAGISHDLAKARAARISSLAYELQFTLRPHATTMPGHEVVRITLTEAGIHEDLPIDFREGTLRSAKLNGETIPPALKNGHLILPAAALHAGANTLETDFEARIATAGAAITRYDDKEDGSEYFYSLFVPMDASMAFPCFDQPDLKGVFTLDVRTPVESVDKARRQDRRARSLRT
jgi:aminopeptidase N